MAYIGKSPAGLGVRARYFYTATGGETSLSGADDNGRVLQFTDGEYVDVYLNGVLLVAGTDYGTGTANTISGLDALSAGNIVEIVAYDIFSLGKANTEALRRRYYKTASGGETSISGSDDDGQTITFAANAEIEVYLNGVALVQGDDYNTSTANTVGGLSALDADDIVTIVAYEEFVLGDVVSKKDGGTFGNSISVSGDLTVDTSTLKVDSTNNRVGIGTTSPSQVLEITNGTSPAYVVQTRGDLQTILGPTGSLVTSAGQVGTITNSPFRFTTNNTERMRIDTSGNVLVGATSNAIGNTGFKINPVGFARIERSGTSSQSHIAFTNGNGDRGSITTNSTSTQYNTTSDYRLKENVTSITDGIERVKQLNPSRFNFIADADTTVDGFLAHEAATVVPEAVTGEKDAMRDEEYEVTPAVLDDDGNVVTEAVMGTRSVPDYQGIDQAKLVPLLTAALQEAIAKIEDLEAQNADFETRLTALEAN